MSLLKQSGFSLIELVIVLIVLVVVGFFGVVPIKGNFWFTTDGVLNSIRVDHPQATEVLQVKRNAIRYSHITVMFEDGTRGFFYLDTNILFNYTIHPVE